MEALQVIWYILIGVLLLGYSILDGFDLGIGTLFPFLAKNETEKRVLLNAIGPFWDGNEVWILTGGGALFAAFPKTYATVFSGFYLALMLVLFALIFRAVSFEFRAHAVAGKGFWEWSFIIGSFLPALLYGVALGNVVYGVPMKLINGNIEYAGSFFTLLRPYPLLIGIFGLVMFLLQGATYAALKSEGELYERSRKTILSLWWAFLVLGIITFIATVIVLPHSIKSVLAWIAAVIAWLGWYLVRSYTIKGKDSAAFYASSLSIIGLWGIIGAIHFPNLVRAINDPSLSLTIYNSSSSKLTLTVMLIIALIGMPIVILYTAYIYKWFKGKVKLEEGGY